MAHPVQTGAAETTVSARRRALRYCERLAGGTTRKIQLADRSRGIAKASRTASTANTIVAMVDISTATLDSLHASVRPPSAICWPRGLLRNITANANASPQ